LYLFVSTTMNKKSIIIGLVCLLGLVVLGIIFGNRPSTVNTVSPKETIMSKEVKLPSNYPTDIPVLPNAKLMDVTEIASEKSVAIRYEIDNSIQTPKQVLDFYTVELAKQGWTVDSPIINEAAGNYITSAKKDSKVFRVINYLSANDKTKTSININLSGYIK
jgi:hypothetical protein